MLLDYLLKKNYEALNDLPNIAKYFKIRAVEWDENSVDCLKGVWK